VHRTGRPRHVNSEREFFIDNLLVRMHLIIVMIRWTGIAPWEFEFPFPGSLTSTFLACQLTPYPPYHHPRYQTITPPLPRNTGPEGYMLDIRLVLGVID